MNKDYKNSHSRQVGEHLVVAELGRKGILATPFAGNLPEIDILAYKDNKTTHIQVKIINKGAWSLKGKNYMNIQIDKEKQILKKISSFDKNLINVFVNVGDTLGSDEFYILNNSDLHKIVYENYSAFLKKIKGKDLEIKQQHILDYIKVI
jgi:Holliday junction resolvase-like predicted endonuclease